MIHPTLSTIKPAQRPTKTRPDATVGRLLAEARLRRNVSLEQVAAQLKIPLKHLVGLEAGDLSVFSAEIYARGAFAKYTTFLGVQTQATQRAFQRVLTGAREYVPLHVHTPQSWLAAQFTPRWVLAAAIGLAAAVVGGYVIWQASSFFSLPALRLIQPVGGIVTTSEITVSGRADTAATVRVNEAQVVVDAAGNFSTRLGVHPGINVIQITATNAAGRTRTMQKDILVPRS